MSINPISSRECPHRFHMKVPFINTIRGQDPSFHAFRVSISYTLLAVPSLSAVFMLASMVCRGFIVTVSSNKKNCLILLSLRNYCFLAFIVLHFAVAKLAH